MTASPGFNHASGPAQGPARPIPRHLYRSRTNRVFAGVCGGIAEYFGSEPTAVRLLTVVIAIFTALVPMLLLYLVAAIIVPERVADEGWSGAPPAGVAISAGQGRLVLGILLVGVGLVAFANEVFRIDWNLLWPVGFIALGGALLIAAQRR